LREKCENLEGNWGWYNLADQLGDQLSDAGARGPFIIRRGTYRNGIDSIEGDMERIMNERGDFGAGDVVDVQLEMPIVDLEAKMNYIRCYHDLLPKRNPVFDWPYWKKYYIWKMGNKPGWGQPLEHYGRLIADATRDDYVSAEVLRGIQAGR